MKLPDDVQFQFLADFINSGYISIKVLLTTNPAYLQAELRH